MNRKSIKAVLTLMCMWIALVTMVAHAMQFERNFPERVKRGKLTTTELAEVVIDGKRRLTSMALRVYNEENAIVPVAHVYVRNAPVNYLEDDFGEILKIWILTPEEAKIPLPKAR